MGDEGGDEGSHTERGKEEDGNHGEDLHKTEVTGADLWWQVAGLCVRDQHLEAEGKNGFTYKYMYMSLPTLLEYE